MNPIIHARNLSKHYGTTKALDAVSFDIKAGRIDPDARISIH